jgi:hypothetical protein
MTVHSIGDIPWVFETAQPATLAVDPSTHTGGLEVQKRRGRSRPNGGVEVTSPKIRAAGLLAGGERYSLGAVRARGVEIHEGLSGPDHRPACRE